MLHRLDTNHFRKLEFTKILIKSEFPTIVRSFEILSEFSKKMSERVTRNNHLNNLGPNLRKTTIYFVYALLIIYESLYNEHVHRYKKGKFVFVAIKKRVKTYNSHFVFVNENPFSTILRRKKPIYSWNFYGHNEHKWTSAVVKKQGNHFP